MTNLSNIVSNFTSISLDEMDGVKLMNRTDTKFAFKATNFLSVKQYAVLL